MYRTQGEAREEVLALGYLSFFARRQEDIEHGRHALREEAVSIASTLADDRARSSALSALADVHSAQGRHELAVARYEEAARGSASGSATRFS